jgi:glycosyltransferase involved in cell wall biosynthesis
MCLESVVINDDHVGRAIFHHPLAIDPDGASASAIRPLRMLEAFQAAGYVVDSVSGDVRERKRAVGLIKRNLAQGVRYDFMYSESSTLPTLLTEPNRIPTWPSVDFQLFRACKKRGVPISLFYRDIYWAFPEFRSRLGFFKFKISESFYRYDLRRYEELVEKIYLPSMEMAAYVPGISASKFDALPPGHACIEHGTFATSWLPGIHILYVGGLGEHYQMQELFRAVGNVDQVKLTVCTRERDWRIVQASYPDPLPANVNVVHESGAQLEKLYADADIASLCVRPHSYREFAVPFKLFEYLGHRMPIMASAGTLSGKFVTDHNIGWEVAYSEASIIDLLRQIAEDKCLLAKKRHKVATLAPDHTWLARAEKVVGDMCQLRQKKHAVDEQSAGN